MATRIKVEATVNAPQYQKQGWQAILDNFVKYVESWPFLTYMAVKSGHMAEARPSAAKRVSAIFITFSGNCRRALTHYQTCFGGTLHFETLELPGYPEKPVISGSLVSDSIVIYGSDLTHSEGRILGNYMAVFLHCKSRADRKALVKKLGSKNTENYHDLKLVEITDAFDVRWILGV